MKITSLKIQNFEGVSRIDLTPSKPVTMIVGRNGQGKSGIAEAVKLALTGETGRDVEKKADYAHLIKEGCKKAMINVQLDTGDSCGIDILKTKSTGSHMSDNALLPYVLDASRFASADSKERRTVLMKATGTSVAPAKVKEMLGARGCDMEKAEQAIPLLRSGFPAAESHCKDRAREAKADWKAVTGETWGSDKGEVWEPETDFDAEALATLEQQHATAIDRITNLNQSIGGMKKAAELAGHMEAKKTELEESAALLDRRQKALEAAQQQLTREEATCKDLAEKAGEKPAESMPCPCCGVVLVSQGGVLVEYEAPEYDPEAAEQLKLHSEALVTCRNTVANRTRDVEASQKAAEALEEWETLDHDPKALEVARNELEKAQTMLADLTTDIADMKKAQGQADKAAAHHKAVTAWLDLAEALGPEGIPAELMAGALSPINERLAQTAADTGWMVPRIDAEMNITANGRRYSSLSESEKWRCNAMFAEAISYVSGTKLLVLDGFDVIEPQNRGALMTWISVLGEYGDVDTLICCGTLKGCPPGNEWVGVHWVEAGAIADPEPKDAKAA